MTDFVHSKALVSYISKYQGKKTPSGIEIVYSFKKSFVIRKLSIQFKNDKEFYKQ